MAEHSLHLVVFDEGPRGLSLHSPNLPGLIYGRSTATEFWADLDDVLTFADAPTAAEKPRVIHHVRRFTTPEGREYLISVELDDALRDREATAKTLLGALEDAGQRRSIFEESPTLVTGEVLFTVVTMSDTIDDVAGGLSAGQITIVVAPGPMPRSIWTTRIADSEMVEDDDERYGLVSDLSLDTSATIGQLFEVLPIGKSRVLAFA